MGDVPGGNRPLGNYPGSPPALSPSHSRLSSPRAPEQHEASDQYRDLPASAIQHGGQSQFQFQPQQPFDSPYQPKQRRPATLQTNLASSEVNIAQQAQHSGRGSPFNMASLGAALPGNLDYGQAFVQQPSQRFPSGPSQPALVYQIPQIAQFPGQMSMNQPTSPSYDVQYPQQYHGKYAHQQTPPQVQQSGPSTGQFIPTQSFMAPSRPPPQKLSPYFYQQGQYSSQGQVYPANQPHPYGAQYGSQSPLSGEGGFLLQQQNSESRDGPGGQSSSSQARAGTTEASASGGQSAVPRGPPRKPKQSGHALWVGNLPPGANVVDLKDHFAREATNDILSVFLISKSNCAFVNYKTEESSAAAMSRFHDGRFQGVRLVCRLRRSSVNAVPGVPTGPAAASTSQPPAGEPASKAEDIPQKLSTAVESKEDSFGMQLAKNKFFIVKSLTVEDLELSVRNGVWATQSHNEDVLNKAYETAENVYLIFSANKSGEYFGYARMISPINDDPDVAIEFASKARAAEDPDLPKAIPTPATEFAPKGRIIDDSARGTIFWEAEVDEADSAGDNEEQRSDHSDQELDNVSPTKTWGRPFKVEWLSTNRLPFYRTRGLRNPWNSNREIKIARDGTELETSVGQRLIQMFHREPSPTTATMPMTMPPVMGGYPQMWPF